MNDSARKRILILAPHSFPVFGAEAIVNINLLRVLAQSGEFEIDLISKTPSRSVYPSASFESYGFSLNSISVVEINNGISLKNLLLFIRSLFHFRIVYWGGLWAEAALNKAKENIQNQDYDYLVTKNNPSFLLGWYLKKKYGLKWVASWNDPFPFSKSPSPHNKEKTRRRTIVDWVIVRRMRCADVHVFPCDRLSRYMQGYLKIGAEKCVTVAHVSSFHIAGRRTTSGAALRMIHSGKLLPPRDASALLQALSTVHNMNPDFSIHLTLVGKKPLTIETMVRQHGLEGYVEVMEPVEYKKSLEMMSDYDVAVIVEAPVKEGIFLPTKVGEYVNMGIPILAISPEVGTLNDLYNQKVIGYFAPVNNVDSIAKEICKIYYDFVGKNLKTSRAEIPFSNPAYVIEQYKKF